MAAVALMMIIIQILCAYIPATALIMISADFDEGKISLAGSMDEVGTECAYILRQILERNQNNWGALGAQGVLVNIFMIALTMDPEKRKQVNIQWKSKEDIKKDFSFPDQVINKLVEVPNINPATFEEIGSMLGEQS